MPRKGHSNEEMSVPCARVKPRLGRRDLPTAGIQRADDLSLEGAVRRYEPARNCASSGRYVTGTPKLEHLVADLTLDRHILQEIYENRSKASRALHAGGMGR